jgi:hypothetical protein
MHVQVLHLVLLLLGASTKVTSQVMFALQDAIASAAVENGDARPSDTLAKAAGEALLTQALNRSTMDNVTVLVLLFHWD